MKTKFIVGLLAVIGLAGSIAVAQQASTNSDNFSDDIFQDLTPQAFSLFDGGGYLGVYAEDINRENMARYNLTQPRGVGITQVAKDSPAEKAGLRKDDVILRVDGENVTSVRKLNRLVSEIAPDQAVRVSISRGGTEQEVTATIAKRQSMFHNMEGTNNSDQARIWRWEGPLVNNGDGDLVFSLSNSRRIGISTTDLTKQLAEYFGVTGGKGVLVTSVTNDGPAARAGIKAGDVITAIDGQEVDSTGDISRAINSKKEGDVTLTIIRNKVQQTLRVSPKEGMPTTIVRPQIGRRIVIPKVEFPETPEIEIALPRIEVPSVNVSVPRIEVPSVNVSMPEIEGPSVNVSMPQIKVPSVNISMPSIRVMPKIRPVKVSVQPI